MEQSNFHDYRVLRMNEVPRIEVHLVRNGEAPVGIGETGTTAGPPALRNDFTQSLVSLCGACRWTASCWPARRGPQRGGGPSLGIAHTFVQ
ncbi:MAG: putative aldehyde dehydrogenase protein [Ramlibacter sp.]|nr:putative aldehyde dehydrogenase protein [Ramlibacter sp.]